MLKNYLWPVIIFSLVSAIELALFVFFSVKLGFLATLFFYFAKTAIGWITLTYLLRKYDLDPGRRLTILEVLTGQENGWRRKGSLIALSVALPGILLTLFALVFSFMPNLRRTIVEKVVARMKRQFYSQMVENIGENLGGTGANPFRESSVYEDNVSEKRRKEDDGAEYAIYESSDLAGTWQTVEPRPNRKSEEKEDPIVVDIPS